MKEERLDALSIMAIENELLQSISFDEIIKIFAAAEKARKMAI